MTVDIFHHEFRTKLNGFPDLLRYSSVIRSGVVLGKGGELIATYKYRGPDMQCASEAELNSLRMRVAKLIGKLGAGWMIHSTTMRSEALSYQENGYFEDIVTAAIEAERRQQYRSEGSHYENDYYLTFTYLPDVILKSKIKALAFDSEHKGKKNSLDLIGKVVDYFERQMRDYVSTLESCLLNRLVRLGARSEIDPITLRPVLYDDHLSYIHECITGRSQPIRLPRELLPVGVDFVVGPYAFVPGHKPVLDGRYIRIVAVESPPDEGTIFGMLEILNKMPVEFRWTTRWIAGDTEKIKARYNVIRSKWRQKIRGLIADMTGRTGGAIDSDAANMAADIEGAMNDISSGELAYGYWTSVVVLRGDNQDQLEMMVVYLKKHIEATGFTCRDEDLNCTEAYFGSLPGHGYENMRRPEISSMNLADCLPLTSVWQGQKENPCSFYKKSYGLNPVPPLFVGSSSGGTPFSVVLHNADVGHTFVGGPTGAGKSVLLGLIAASHMRYKGAKFFAFDKGESMLALCLGAGGNHYNFLDEDSEASMSIGFAPFAKIDRLTERGWAVEYVEAILTLHGVPVDLDVLAEVRRAINLLASRPVDMRSFTDLAQLVQMREVRAVLALYEEEMCGGMLNAKADNISTGRFTVFEMEQLLNLSDKHVVPVLLYLFRMIERALDGSPAIICLDEAWVVLKHEMFEEKLKEWFKVLRKANCLVIFATQELQDVANSPIRSTIFSACQTKILLPNPEAQGEENARLYRSIGLSDREIELLVYSTPKRDYFFSSPAGRRLFQLELGPVALAFVAASGVDDRREIKELYKIHGENWAPFWLKKRGVNPDALKRAWTT